MLRNIILNAVLSVGILSSACYAHDFKCVNDEVRSQQQMEACYKASCRVYSGNAYGSGTFFLHQNKKCYILTNYHVVTSATKVRCDFWTNGQMESVSGKVVWRGYNESAPYDFAVIEINENDLAKIDPPYIPIAPENWLESGNSFILSAGCPKGRNVVAWTGRITGPQGVTIRFKPAPVPGQSGSSIISRKDGKAGITHVLTWLIGQEGSDQSEGGAIPIGNLIAALRGTGVDHEVGEKVNNIPEGAIECAGEIEVLIFRQPNCSPCDAIETHIPALKEAGINVKTVDLTKFAGAVEARNYNVKQTPTTIVIDTEGNVLKSIVGYTDLTVALKEYYPTKKENTDGYVNRPPVCERLNDTTIIDGIIRGYSDLGGDYRAPETPNQDNNNDIDLDKLGEKLSNSLNGKISKEFAGFGEVLGTYLSNSVDGIKSNIDKNFTNATESVNKTITERIKEFVKPLWDSIVNALILTLIIIIALIWGIVVIAKLYLDRAFNSVKEAVEKKKTAEKKTTTKNKSIKK